MDTFLQDVRFGARTLVRSPAFTLIAIACLALGIGVNTAIFSVVNGILMTPFGFSEPERLVVLNSSNPPRDIQEAGMSYQDFRDLRRDASSFEGMAAQTFRSLTLTDLEEPVRLPGATISWNLFPILGIRPHLGRTFREDEDRLGASGTVLLGYDVWVQRFGADSAILGRTIGVNGRPHAVVGVMPERFKFPEAQELWIPMEPIEGNSPRGDRGLSVFGRLADGATVDQARLELIGLTKRLEEEYRATNEGWTASLATLQDELIPSDIKLIVLTMMGAVTFVLIIACANVANLMLARASGRQREIAIRSALGAGRRRMMRMLLTESVILALSGGILGIAVAHLGLRLLDAAMPAEGVPYYIDWQIDGEALAYMIAVSVVTGLLFGLAPALQVSGGDLQGSLKEGGRGTGSGARRNRLRSVLVVAEVALSVVLLVGASLFVRTFVNLRDVDAGFDERPLLTFRIYLPGDRYVQPMPKALRVDDVIRRIEALPGVVAATASNSIALGGGGGGGPIEVDGLPVERGKEPRIFWAGVTAHWFRALDVPIARGRDFTDAEGRDSSRVAVINQTMADRFWKGADPIGRRFRFVGDTGNTWFTVIGVTRDFVTGQIDPQEEQIQPSAFVPYPFMATLNTGFMVRTASTDPARVMPSIRAEVRGSDPILPVFEVQTMDELRELGYWQFGLFGRMFSIFGLIALGLAAVGVYGVISYGVAQRTHEIGVRMALGARAGDVLRLIVRQGMTLSAIGLVIGLVGAAGVTQVIGSLLFEVDPIDPLSFAGVALFLTSVAALASYIPARRAMAVDPVTALRYE
jgi:putative ABC transport system permease protein